MLGHLHFFAGLPRSGSTLLMNLLGQNPGAHVTPTNDLLSLLLGVRDRWMHLEGFLAQGLPKIRPRVLGAMQGLLRGFYREELAAGRHVIDKSRGWLAHIPLLEQVLGRKVKLVVTVRAVEDVVASFEKIHRKSALTEHAVPAGSIPGVQTVAGRAERLLSPGGVAGIALNRLRNAMQLGLQDRLIIVPYQALTMRPVETTTLVAGVLGLPAFRYNPNEVAQLTHEDDSIRGMELHTIRPKVESETKPGWVGVLPAGLAQRIAKDYADINAMAAGPLRFVPT